MPFIFSTLKIQSTYKRHCTEVDETFYLWIGTSVSHLKKELRSYTHARQLIYCRFIKFVNSLVDHKKDCIRSLFNMVVGDVRSLSGDNLRRVILDTGVLASPGKTSPCDLHNYKVYPVQLGMNGRLVSCARCWRYALRIGKFCLMMKMTMK